MIRNPADPEQDVFAATWVLVMPKPEPTDNVGGAAPWRQVRTWTDDYSNLFEVLR